MGMAVEKSANQSSNTEYHPRSPRIQNPIGREGSLVRYMGPGLGVGADYKTAVLADVSQSGARLISRMPTRAKNGDFLSLEFSLPGSDRRIKSQARVVRKINEFVFAVRFIGVGDQLQGTIDDSIEEFLKYRRFPVSRFVPNARRWLADHKQGVVISLAACAVALSLGTYVYLNSDEYAGRSVRPWGQEVPQTWYWDYVNKFNK
jgi:hypothetical protein